MEITSVKLFKPKVIYGHVVAIASVVVDDAICINDIKVISTSEKTFISMPNKKVNAGYKDIAYPINKESRALIENAIIKKYMEEK